VTHKFCPGYSAEPFATLCQDYPDSTVYPLADFRVEWGPIFHRGRLDGSARVLVIGQDPAAHEAVTRRILVGEAGQRTQGFLAKLGIDTSYTMVNTYLYSVFGQGGGDRHKNDPAIASYRNRWLDALLVGQHIEAVVTLGGLAATALSAWLATPAASKVNFAHAAIVHPTFPESSSASGAKTLAAATAEMLANWNEALPGLHAAIQHPDSVRPLVLYGQALTPGDHAPIPEQDLPAGLPDWTRSLQAWASRQGATADDKRATIVVSIPKANRSWISHP
jgi:uracil-DNA glycosylase